MDGRDEAAAPRPHPSETPTTATEAQDLATKLSQINITNGASRLQHSISPYLRALSRTPVSWHPLDDAAVARAKAENKLIFLNIGFNSCHYCQRTIEDSFSHPQVSALLNTAFIPIAVDREERPDIDAVYLNYMQAVNQAAGWPINVFLTPDLEPIYGGTYWPGPGVELVGLNGERISDETRLDFLVVLHKMETVWKELETRCRTEARECVMKLRDFAAEGTLGNSTVPSGEDSLSAAAPRDPAGPRTMIDSELDLDQLEEAYTHIAGTYDRVNGGFGLAPKFPTPAKLSFLLRLGVYPEAVTAMVGTKEIADARLMALGTLTSLRRGGLRNHVGGGFARYCVTADWTIPHFEQMVADNALLLGVYLDAWLITARDGQETSDNEYKDMVLELVDYLTSTPILRSDGAFATSRAADSLYRTGDKYMREGAYYLWTRREFDDALQSDANGPDQRTSAIAAAYWDVRPDGNISREQDRSDEFINQNVLREVKDVAALAKQFGMSTDEVRHQIEIARRMLQSHRERDRVQPAVDRKVVASINGMVISALARTASALGGVDKARSSLCLAAATKAASVLKAKLWDVEAKILYRAYDEVRSPIEGFADDYAYLVDASLELYAATGEETWLEWADDLQLVQIDLFYDSTSTHTGQSSTPQTSRSHCGGFYSTIEKAPHVLLRLKDGMDTAMPSTNTVSATNLFRLGHTLGDAKYIRLAHETINAFECEMLQYPWLFVGLLGNIVTARLGGSSTVIDRQNSAGGAMQVMPRSGPKSVIFLPIKENSWLGTRNTLLGGLKAGEYEFRDGTYVSWDTSVKS